MKSSIAVVEVESRWRDGGEERKVEVGGMKHCTPCAIRSVTASALNRGIFSSKAFQWRRLIEER